MTEFLIGEWSRPASETLGEAPHLSALRFALAVTKDIVQVLLKHGVDINAKRPIWRNRFGLCNS